MKDRLELTFPEKKHIIMEYLKSKGAGMCMRSGMEEAMKKTTCIMKKIASITLAVALVLPAFVGVSVSSAAEADATTTLLKDYAAKITFLGSDSTKTYDGLLKKESADESLQISAEKVPTDPIGYRIDDFDQDGANELLVIEQDADHCGKLVMYEVVDSAVKKTAETELVEFDDGDYKECYKSGLDWTIGDSSCFVYVQGGKKYIGVEEYSSANYIADGIEYSFLRMIYDGTSFKQDAKFHWDGSDMNYYDIVVGIYDSLNLTTDLETAESDSFRVRDFVTSKVEFATSLIVDANVDYEITSKMQPGDSIKGSTISFETKNNIAAETDNLTDIGDGSPKNLTPGKASVKSVKSKSGKLVIKLKHTTKAQGYQIEYNGKKKNVDAWNDTWQIKAKKGKKYSVRVRAFAKIGGKTVYGKWSAKKSVKVK